MRLYHITSPESAMAVMDSGKFYPASTYRLNNDNGLNCFSFKPGYRLGQRFEGEGAKIILEWTGPVAITHQDTSPPLLTDILHDQFPWRCFVRGGSNPNHLRMVAIRFDNRIVDDMIHVPRWHKILPEMLRSSLYRRAKLMQLRDIRTNYRNGNRTLEVIG
jgi:hypothetical protein